VIPVMNAFRFVATGPFYQRTRGGAG
jgi:hypothetical protein